MSPSLTVISSKATQAVLSELCREFESRSGFTLALESVGGVDAAKRIRAGEVFDVVILARQALDDLAAGNHVVPGTQTDIVLSGVAVAVRAGARRPAIASEEALRDALLAASSIGYSTGPSGVELAKLFERWNIAETLRERIVVAPPGVPVGSLVARGEVELGFQQLAELIHLSGIDIVGPLPDSAQIITTFSAAISGTCQHPALAQSLIAFLASEETATAKRRQGMEPV